MASSRKLPLKNGGFALVDAEDYDRVYSDRWYLRKTGDPRYAGEYVVMGKLIGGKSRRLFLHREVMRAGPNDTVDHINHDTKDNRKSNLRFVSKSQSNANRKPFKTKRSDLPTGVKRCFRRFSARIQVQGKRHFLGQFDTAEEAYAAYLAAAEKYFGEYHYEVVRAKGGSQ